MLQKNVAVSVHLSGQIMQSLKLNRAKSALWKEFRIDALELQAVLTHRYSFKVAMVTHMSQLLYASRFCDQICESSL